MRSRRWQISVMVALVTVLAVWGCGNGPAEPEGAKPTFVGTWAGARWAGKAYALHGLTDDTLYIHGASPVGATWNAESTISIRVPYEGAGTYVLGPGDCTFTRLVGGDVMVGRYGTTTEEAGVMTIVEQAGRRIAGVVSCETRDVWDPAPNPPIVRFEGTFEATMPD